MSDSEIKFPLHTAQRIAQAIQWKLKPHCLRCEIVGSTRREKEEVGDIEIVVLPHTLKVARDLLAEAAPERTSGFIQACNSIGHRKAGDPEKGKLIKYIHRTGGGPPIQVEIYVADTMNYGYIKMLRTGPADFSHRMFGIEIKKMKHFCKGGHIYCERSGRRIPVPNEENVFKIIGINYIEPQFRI